MSDAYGIADWPVAPGVRACMTDRTGGFSVAPFDTLNLGRYVGDPAAQQNRDALCSLAGLPSAPRWLHQVHSTRCVNATDVTVECEADASWTGEPGVVLAALAADCLPVLFAASDGSCVAAAHAGWRGLAGGVLENTLAALPVAAGCVSAWLGPAIGPSAFEVGTDVRDAFCDAAAQDDLYFTAGAELGKYRADLFGLARARLMRAGVASVYGGGVCTVSNPATCFSHRRDRGQTGRMAALIWRA